MTHLGSCQTSVMDLFAKIVFTSRMTEFQICQSLCLYLPYVYILYFGLINKQPFRGVLRKKCSEDMQQNYRRTPMLKFDFNKVALQLY